MCTSVNSRVWTVNALLLLLDLSTARDVKLCANDSILELTAGLNTSIICEAERDVQWRLHVAHHGTNTSFSLANCTEEGCTPLPFFPETFLASVKNNHTKLIIINTENNTKIYNNIQLVNGVLECTSVNNAFIERSARCGLNYVFPPENVSCQGVTASWSVHVSCVIGSVYSSRGIYRCQLFTRKQWNESLETVDMVTTPTNESISRKEVKVSGFCQFNTTFSSEEECYGIFVSVSPGGKNYSVKLKDVAYTPCFLINGGNKNTTAMEGDLVHFACISYDQPPTQMYIYNHDNNSVVWTQSTFSNYTFIARCEDTAVYSCGNKSSVRLNLYVNCAPRNLLLKNLDVVKDKSNQVVITFEVMAFPAPHQCNMWFVGSSVSSSEAAFRRIEGSMANITCKAFTWRRYLYRCSLAVLDFPSQLGNGTYKIQVINEAGNENFTVDHIVKDQERNHAALSGGVIAAVAAVILAAVLIVIRRRRFAKDNTSSDFSSSDTAKHTESIYKTKRKILLFPRNCASTLVSSESLPLRFAEKMSDSDFEVESF